MTVQWRHWNNKCLHLWTVCDLTLLHMLSKIWHSRFFNIVCMYCTHILHGLWFAIPEPMIWESLMHEIVLQYHPSGLLIKVCFNMCAKCTFVPHKHIFILKLMHYQDQREMTRYRSLCCLSTLARVMAWCLVLWWHQSITWTNVGLSFIRTKRSAS